MIGTQLRDATACAAMTVGLLVMMGATSAQAQTRPFRGLFGAPTRESSQTVNLVGSVQGGYDDHALAQEPGGGDPLSQVGSSFFGARGSIAYGDQWGAVSIGVAGDASFQRYPDISYTSRAFGVGAGLGVDFSRRTRLRLSQSLSFRPSYQFTPFPVAGSPILGEAPPSNLDHSLVSADSVSWSSGLVLERNLSPRSMLSATADYSTSRFSGTAENELGVPELSHARAGVRFTRSITPGLGIRLGYAYRRGTYGTELDPEIESHELDVGADYARRIALGPRTTFGFSTGSALVRSERGVDATVLGNANLDFEISRSWLARAAYDRSMSFVAGFEEPLFQDAVGGNVGGALGERTRLGLSGGYSRGALGVGDGASPFEATTGQATVQVLLTSILAAECQYFLYWYEFDPQSTLPFGLPSRFKRQGVRAALTVALPLGR